ncbi:MULTISPECIES: Gfo/Idh/MocA family protein [Acidobacteriaceae]|uniref:Gfo/Idh/MocA family protein n=1 Tax=Acidobacteriaceae TaxID=204434 RepID=UPI00131DA277|nr:MULTISPECIES: Gfo/Idh/MocA family oxidoreductase [Acidobacteriaceae]MDW5264818.1 Gfo/Idh/MocA family oxidoreductase [Edaphobacter sp.]
MTQAPVRFAILGFGYHAVRRLLPAFAPCNDATLVGMWRRDQSAAAQDCATHKIAHCFATREELCASPEVDVVFITSPDAMHKDDTLLALKHGKAVLCEKPLSMNTAEAEEMAAAAKAAGLLFGVGQNFRFNHSLDWMREQVAAGRIGQPQIAHAQYSYPAANAPRKWITDPTLACGGPIADVGVHCIDALRYVLGEDVVSVSTLARRDDASGKVEAIASLQLEMTGDVYANVTASARAPYRTLIEINGSDGVLVAENGLTVDRPVQLQLRRAGELVETVTLENGDGYTRMLDSFARAFRGEETFAASGEDGVRNMRALDAAYKSWQSGLRETV